MKKDVVGTHFTPLQDQALHDLADLVNINSCTDNIQGLRAAGQAIADMAARNGLHLEKVPAQGSVAGAWHLAADCPDGEPFFGVLGHFDTVHQPDSGFDRFSRQDDVLRGPGVLDMKSGIVAAVYGLRVAREVLGRERLPVKVVFNCDEETGSRDSRPLIERMMPGAKAAFIFEGRRQADNALVTSRKGIMMGRMTVTGRAAHAGEAPQDGANAIVEAAHKIIALAGLTHLENGVVVTTGRIKGGEVDNQIPDYCHSGIDIRFRSPRQGEEIRAAVKAIMERSHVPGCATEFSLQTVRPPFQKSEAGEALREKLSLFAAEFGVELAEKEAGGGSDGNLTAALGVPTLDGMGPAGDHAHTHQEYILASSFFNAIMTFALFFANELEA